MPNQVVAYIAKLEDTTGLKRPSEERPPVLVDAVTSDMLLEKRRMVTDMAAKQQRWSKSECDAHFTLGFISIYGIE
jgi:hypothetical protein